jgi:hypothetical protein
MRHKPPLRVRQSGWANVWSASVPDLGLILYGTGHRRVEGIRNALSRIAAADHAVEYKALKVNRDGFYQPVAPFIKGDPLVVNSTLLERERGRNHLFTPSEKRKAYKQLQTAVPREYWPWLAPLTDYLDLPQVHNHPRLKNISQG